MPVVSLTTDFGEADGYVGVLKGVILSIAGTVPVIDLTHALAQGDIKSGAWVLNNSYRFFPRGSVHMAVVDPGVGLGRRAVIVRNQEHAFVLPDNGLISCVLAQPNDWQAFVIDKPEYWLPAPSNTFHGRDIFAPVAAHLSKGLAPEKLGSEIDLETLVIHGQAPVAKIGPRLVGEVVHIDRFGNLITNLPSGQLLQAKSCRIGDSYLPIGIAYSSVNPGCPLAIAGSHGFVEIAVFGGRADEMFGREQQQVSLYFA